MSSRCQRLGSSTLSRHQDCANCRLINWKASELGLKITSSTRMNLMTIRLCIKLTDWSPMLAGQLTRKDIWKYPIKILLSFWRNQRTKARTTCLREATVSACEESSSIWTAVKMIKKKLARNLWSAKQISRYRRACKLLVSCRAQRRRKQLILQSHQRYLMRMRRLKTLRWASRNLRALTGRPRTHKLNSLAWLDQEELSFKVTNEFLQWLLTQESQVVWAWARLVP